MKSESKNSWDVFLSYSSRNKDVAIAVADDLRKAGLKVWFDRSQIGGGQRLREQIEIGLRNSKSVLVLTSQFSLKSRWVLNELDAAMLREITKRKTIVAFALGKSYISESLKCSDRIHAIAFGKFYLQAYGETATWADLKEVFQHWNIDRTSTFSSLDSAQIDPQILSLLADVVKSALGRNAGKST